MDALSMFSLQGETALVTGGGQGIGREMAMGLAEAGADVVVVQRHLEVAEKTAKDIEKMGRRSLALQADVSDPRDVERMVSSTLDRFGKLDIMVNNAGVAGWVAAEDMTIEEWNRVVNINLNGVFLCCQEAGKAMIKQKKGCIINTSSISGFIANHPQRQCHYNAAKGGVNTLTKCLAYEWAEHNIRVNAIAPGFVATPMVLAAEEKVIDEWRQLNVQKRMAEPSEFKGIVVFLASQAASYITGHILVADGGYTIW